ncbi:MAG: UDP-N-acetylmuramoyl-tripeptide--D-alanyl-D-alanine ligase [Treponema sp.]|nr:UDP-N-acetylmuramoyl-tripeptide--D-alanyl-D-alanine ligase [Treponema sp.]
MDNSGGAGNCLMSFAGLSRALGARLFDWEGEQAAPRFFSSVSIDSRAVAPGGLFVALRGSARDGHCFVDAAFRAGAAGALVALSALEDPALNLQSLAQRWKGVLVAVEDTLKGLQDAARVYLEQFPALLKIGITGSAGKTTTKEIAAAIIGHETQVVMNQGNLNSETGLPLSVFSVRAKHQAGIFEAGMNRAGEIGELAKVLNPKLALITNIGSAHIGILGSRDAIAEEKKKIFSQFTGNNTALIPADDDYRDFLAKDVRGKTVFYGASSLPGLGAVRDLGLEGTEITWEGEKIRFGLPGKFNLRNALAAIALAMELPVSSDSIRRGLEAVKPLFGRGEILRGRATVIRDCYNSNPESAMAALDFCDNLEWDGRRVYVIGSMLELGDSSAKAHAALGRRLASCRADMVFLFGDETAAAADALGASSYGTSSHGANSRETSPHSPLHTPSSPSPHSPIPCFHTRDMGDLSRALDAYIKNGDLVLLKGSRGCALETLTGMLTGGAHVS